MVKQGSIIKINFDPALGHEQKGYRPALVISNSEFHKYTRLSIICPITTTDNGFPLHIELPDTLKTKGFVLTEHIKCADIESRGYSVAEEVAEDFLLSVTNVIKLFL